jgi:hypothetical protein
MVVDEKQDGVFSRQRHLYDGYVVNDPFIVGSIDCKASWRSLGAVIPGKAWTVAR